MQKISLKKLTFATLHATHFEIFFRSDCIFIYQVVNKQRKICSFFEKRLSFAHLSTTHGENFTLLILLLIFSRDAGCEYKLFSSFSLIRPVIEPKSAISAADTLSTRLMIKNDKFGNINSVVIISQLRCFLTFAGQSRPEARKTIKINSVVIYSMLRCTFD